MSIADEIAKLDTLRASGAITENEYQQAKGTLLSNVGLPGEPFNRACNAVCNNPNTWSMFIHLSVYGGAILPGAGLVIPVLLWQLKKNESPIIDQHGKNVVNGILTGLVYGLISIPLCFILIGYLLMLAVLVAYFVFPIIGGIKANNGEVWRYPYTIVFIK